MDSNKSSMSAVEVNTPESVTKTGLDRPVSLERLQGRRSLAGVIYRPPIDAQPGHYKIPLPPGPPELRIVRSLGSDFKKRSTNPILEVLLEEPRVSIGSRLRKSSLVESDYFGQNVNLTGTPIVIQKATRIRIRSYEIFRIFESMGDAVGVRFNMPRTLSHVFLYPFKLFLHLEPYIRNRLFELESADRDRLKTETNVREKAIPFWENEGDVSPFLDQPKSSEQTTANDDRTLEALRLLTKVFDTDLKDLFDLRRRIQEKTLTKIAYADLWLLFNFGQDVKTPDSKMQVYRVLRWTGGREILAKHGFYAELQARAGVDASSVHRTDVRNSAFYVECVSFEFDGEQYGPVQNTFLIRKYDGEKPITSLPVYPLAFSPEEDLIRTRLIERGNLYLQLSRINGAAHRHYSGLTLDEPHEEIDSPIIVDTREAVLRYYSNISPVGIGNLVEHNLRETYEETVNPTVTNGVCSEDGCCDNENIFKDYDWDLQREELFFDEHKTILAPTTDPDDIDDGEKILLPPFVYGFVLRSRKWAKFDIDAIRNVDYSSGLDDLVLPSGHKETVRALVANHSRLPRPKKDTLHTERSINLVKGKGRGLVILLHGAPGVGKTSTAECVADSTKRPLFPITCGDIGDTAPEVETNLEKNFQLAHKWGCVLLLDEADIFLQKRDKADIRRNAIVSVFLRTLEYYSGILFLTTNRVGIFDPAFRSRIHVSLYYPVLRKEATMQIWKMHLARTQTSKGDQFKIKTKEILKFAKNHYIELKKAKAGSWNGRQICNAFQTAIALAEFEAVEKSTTGKDGYQKHNFELNERHFATVTEASKDFDRYLLSTLGGQTEADVARLDQTRVDDFQKLVEMAGLEKKSRGKAKRRGKIDFDSEDSALSDSEECDDDSESSNSSSGGTEDEPIPVKQTKSKKEKHSKRSKK